METAMSIIAMRRDEAMRCEACDYAMRVSVRKKAGVWMTLCMFSAVQSKQSLA